MLVSVTAIVLVLSGCVSGQNDNVLQTSEERSGATPQSMPDRSMAGSNPDTENYTFFPNKKQSSPGADPSVSLSSPTTESPLAQIGNGEESTMRNIAIIVDGKVFYATLYDNETAKALVERLPLTLDMGEMNGNEKYYYLDSSLPTDASNPGRIRNGDLMLYGSDCLVLFYEDFSTVYRYTPLGRVDNPAGLAGALGGGNVTVTFQIK